MSYSDVLPTPDNVFFVSDTHFNHPNVIRYCDRPFHDVNDMNRGMISNWNQLVRPGDHVFHLGDFAMKSGPMPIPDIVDQLNGTIHLVTGNHDKVAWQHRDCFEWVKPYHDLNLGHYANHLNQINIVMMHYPIEVWDRRHYGSIHIHGHVHSGSKITAQNRVDVGVDSWGYSPVSVEQLFREIAGGDTHDLSGEKQPPVLFRD